MSEQRAPFADELIDRVGNQYGVRVSEMKSRLQFPRISRARSIACWLLKEYGCTLGEIARLLRRKDHTSASYCVRKIENERKERPEFAEELLVLKGAK